MSRVEVTIAVLCHDREDFIGRAIRSALDQNVSRLGIEVLVVDDASTDSSIDVIRGFLPHVNILENRENLGVGASSAIAVEQAKGEYFLRLDSDDYLSRFSIQSMHQVLRFNPEYSFVFSDHEQLDDKGVALGVSSLDSLPELLTHGAGILFRKQAILEIGNYDSELRDCEDYDLLARMIAAGHRGFRLPVPMYKYRKHEQTLTSHSSRLKNVERMSQKYEGIFHRSGQIHW